MKFSPFEWVEVIVNEPFQVEQGRLRLRLTHPASLFLEAEGVNAFVGTEKDFEVQIAQEMNATIVSAEPVMAFKYVPPSTSVEFEGEIFTNIDRMSVESGSMYEVSKAMRLFELQKRNMLREMRQELEQLKAVHNEPDEPEPAAETEPDSSEQADAPEDEGASA